MFLWTHVPVRKGKREPQALADGKGHLGNWTSKLLLALSDLREQPTAVLELMGLWLHGVWCLCVIQGLGFWGP